MSVAIDHHHDRAVITFADAVTWTSAFALVRALDTAVDAHFHRLVELVVTSPGGDVRALRHVLDALEARRCAGVRLRTRVLADAHSAAAVLVCVGDERLAAPGARLLFHFSRAHNVDPVTASDTAALLGALDRVDARLLGLLVERTMRGVDAKRPLSAEPDDRAVLERLVPSGRGEAKRRRSTRALARTLGRSVTRAVAGGDREALDALYRRLLETDRALSAPLACTLGLIDAVVPPESAPREAPDDDAPAGLVVPEWAALYPPHGAVPRAHIVRHALVLGETGSGKTASAVLPVAAALARASATAVKSALVIDPKGELEPALRALAPGRLRAVRADEAVLDLMASPRHRLDADLAAGRWLTAATRILARVVSFVPTNPACTLFAGRARGARDLFFDKEGASLARTVLALVLMLTDERAPEPSTWLDRNRDALDWVEALRARASTGPNAVALTAWALDSALLTPAFEEPISSRGNAWLFARLARTALRCLDALSAEARDLLERVVDYWAATTEAEKQYLGTRSSAATVCAELAAPAIARSLYFGCEPGLRGRRPSVDFTRAVDPGARACAPLVVYRPARDDTDRILAIALKAAFFEAVLDDPVRARGGAHLPLVGYVADEAHRFLTADVLHGEQSFLDTCRSFGAACLLACQSVASLEHALAHQGGTRELNEASVAILWANTGTKLAFKSTDPSTAERITELCPERPGHTAVTRVRPLASLGVGECYALLADGRFERRQLAPFALGGERAPTGRPKT